MSVGGEVRAEQAGGRASERAVRADGTGAVGCCHVRRISFPTLSSYLTLQFISPSALPSPAPLLLQDGQLDPAVMSTLPPSLQLDLMLKMREQKQAANRQQFEARRAAPASFSQFQMQQYLAATRFRWAGGAKRWLQRRSARRHVVESVTACSG